MDVRLSGVICPLCAATIVSQISGWQEIKRAIIDLEKHILHVEAEGDWPSLYSRIKETVLEQIPDAILTADMPCSGVHADGAEKAMVLDRSGEVYGRKDHAPHAAAKLKSLSFLLPNLDCAVCGETIEAAVAELDEVSEAKLDFSNRRLTVLAQSEDLLEEIALLAAQVEPGTVVKRETTKRRFSFEGLSCAHCAEKIKEAVEAESWAEDVQMDFVNKRLSLASILDEESLIERIQRLTNQIEEGILVQTEAKIERPASAGDQFRQSIKENKKDLIAIGIAAVLFIAGHFQGLSQMDSYIFFLAYLMVGAEVLWHGLRGIVRGQVFGEEVLMAIASTGAFAIGAHEEAVAVMLFFRIGEFVQDLAVARSRQSIGALMDIRPEFATLRVGSELQEVDPEAVNPGDVIVVRPGEKIPLDGKVIEGESMVDTAALTGESVPRRLSVGDRALSGGINQNALLAIEVTARYADSTVAKILELVEHAAARKAKMERFITRFARVYTPAVVGAAVALVAIPMLLLPGAVFSDWLYRALLFLVCSCPCALVISVPLSFFGGIGGASRAAVLVKGANYLEALAEVDTVVFDKTGTLTRGTFEVTDVQPEEGIDKAALLSLAAAAERHSTHPIARSICAAEPAKNLKMSAVEEVVGRGIIAQTEKGNLLVGNAMLLEENGIAVPDVEAYGSVVFVAADNRYLGFIVVSDELKDDAKEAVSALSSLGIRKTVLLTGDRQAAAEYIARELGVDEVEYELLPGDKVTAIERLQENTHGRVAFLGDGLNDAPVLARADVGIAMGGLGSDAAIEAADVVLMNDAPSTLARAIRISRRTRGIVWQNVIFALGIKAAVLLLGALGIATMWAAVFADVGVTFLAILNAMRAIQIGHLNK